jgi:hypothetical protein
MKGRKYRADGGVNSAAKDLSDKPARYNNADKIFDEAEERKHGGRTKRKHGGMAEGMEAKMHAGRKARKSGGSCEASPFSSARAGTPAKGRKTDGSLD